MRYLASAPCLSFALGISAVSAVNAAPAVFKFPSTIAYDQGGNDPFPTSAPEAGSSGVTITGSLLFLSLTRLAAARREATS